MKIFINKIKNEFEIGAIEKDIFIQSIFCGLLIFLGIFWKWFELIALVFLIFFIIINNTAKSTYFLIFLIPIFTIFRVNLFKFYFIYIVLILITLWFALDLLKKFIKKEKNINWGLSLTFIIFVLYCFIISLSNNIKHLLIFVTLSSLLYLLFYYKKDFKLKSIALFFALGLLFSTLTGICKPISPRLQSMQINYYANGFFRFSGATLNTNTFGLDLAIMLSLLTTLYMKGEIKLLYYPFYFFSILLVSFTLGKTTFILILFNMAVFVLFNIIKKRKTAFKPILIILGLFCLVYVFTGPRISSIFSRFDVNNNNNLISQNNSIEQSKQTPQNILYEDINTISTGRVDIWITYIENLLSSPVKLIFGKGLGFEYLTMNEMSVNCHSTYIECIYTLGILGVIFFILYFLILCKDSANKPKFNIPSLFIISVIILISIIESLLTYRLLIYLFILMISISDKNEKLYDYIPENFKENIAILTPSYNREKLIGRCYESLLKQTSKNFVWYVVDDGSTDNTEKVVKTFQQKNKQENDFEIVYIKKENGGKHTALNVGLANIKENYVTILDSDDWFLDNAIETIENDVPKIASEEFCGLGYLKLNSYNEYIGKKYTEDEVVDTFINQRYNKNTFGDKTEVFKTEILKKYPFPEFKGEKFVSEATIWCKMSGIYKMLFINKGFYICEYQEGGLSNSIHRRLFNNPNGSKECYKIISGKEFKLELRIKYTIAYIVYALAAGLNLKQMKQDYKENKLLVILLYLPAKIIFKKKRKLYSGK